MLCLKVIFNVGLEARGRSEGDTAVFFVGSQSSVSDCHLLVSPLFDALTAVLFYCLGKDHHNTTVLGEVS